MSKPTETFTWATDGGAVVTEPLAGEKAAGFSASTKPRASWFNYLFNTVGQWIAWLNGLQAEALTWAALQTLSDGLIVSAPATLNRSGVVAAGNGTGAAVEAGAGHIKLTGTVPTPTTSYSDFRSTPANTPIATGFIHFAGGVATIREGFNLEGTVTPGVGMVDITLNKPVSYTSAFNNKAVVLGMCTDNFTLIAGHMQSATVVRLYARDTNGNANVDLTTHGGIGISFVVFGRP